MSIVLDGTSGITAPALDSDGSLTIGTAVMAVPTGDAPLFGCRAWVNFDGTKDTTGAASTANTNRLIRGSGNVTSVLRNGTGDYTVTFTTAMPDANYSATCIVSDGVVNTTVTAANPIGEADYATSTFRIRIVNNNVGANDSAVVNINIFR